MPDIHVRTARFGEEETILRLVHESMSSYCRDSGIPDSFIEATFESAETVRDAISSGVVFVALNDEEEILGTCRLYIRPRRELDDEIANAISGFSSRIAYFARFSVWDKWRSQGIGNYLLSYCERVARLTHCSHILLHTALSNKGMVAYYEAHGFQILASDDRRGYERGLFGKKLAPLPR
ncbi:MAG: GNAT family N-acetyltransferase [Clostridiales bacterium]|nr:GNAT family N-acetyltransferase [Clostridiales bacterium]